MAGVELCQLPPAPPADCCDAVAAPPAAPLTVDNEAGLDAIAYRIGTFTSFRRAMLDDVARANLLGAAPNPFLKWKEGSDGDYHTTFIELWAYLADILTFYQERIANEAYIGTATQRDSSLRIVKLIDYKPGPGAGASGLAAFTVAKGKVVSVPAGFRVGSRAAAGKQAATFETSVALVARAEHSAIQLSSVAPTNQFAQLSSFGAIFSTLGAIDKAIALEIYGAAGNVYFSTFPLKMAAQTVVQQSSLQLADAPRADFAISGAFSNASSFTSQVVRNDLFLFPYVPFVNLTTRSVVLQGVSNRLSAGDYVLAVEMEGATGEKPHLYQISTVNVDKTAKTTTISWQEPSGTTYQQTVDNPVNLYAMRVKAGAFGNTAPPWLTLPSTLTNSDGKHPPPAGKSLPYPNNWDDPANAKYRLPNGGTMFLDAVYDSISGSSDKPGWIGIVPEDRFADPKIAQVVDARPLSHSDYALTAKVTRVTLDSSVSFDSSFGVRETLIVGGAEKLALQNNLPLPDPVQGDTLILAGLFPNLMDGQAVVIQGVLFGSTDGSTVAEYRLLTGPPLQDAADNLTTVKLNKPLKNQYIRSTTVLLANVVAITQGETVKDEVLGNGNAKPFQTFALKKKPLTYLPSTDPEGLSAVASTLIVTVDGVRWTEQPTLLESGPDAREFTTTLDDTAQTSVMFGDGINGARPATGVNNIRARYRKGLGVSGNVAGGGVAQLLDSLPGLQQVTNPQSTAGGADAESLDQIRTNAPSSVRTFNRAVSAADYAAVALTFPGISKASATWVTFDASFHALAQPYIQLTVATPDRTPINGTPLVGQLRSYLDKRRDPNIPLRILDFAPVYVDVVLTVDLDDAYPRQATFAQVQAALNPGLNADGSAGYFAFERLGFGENLHLSALYAAVQNVPGVRDANITTFRRMDVDANTPSLVRNDIFVGPTQIAVIGNDPAHKENGLLTIVQGTGGFVDA